MVAAVEVPPLQSLRTLEVLSRTRRVGAAAVELRCSHSAVSQTVSRLEKRFGVELFLKGSRGVEATPECRELIDAYLAAASTLARALPEASGARRFRVLAPKTAWRWLTPTVARLCRSAPDLCFHAYHDDEAVDLGEADFAIVAAGHTPPSGFTGTPLYDEQLMPVCSPAFARSAKVDTPASLARSQLLVSRRDQWLSWFSRAGLSSTTSVTGPLFSDSALALETALRGQGVALCCTVAAAPAISQGELVAPVPVSVSTHRRLWAVWRDARLEPAMRVLDWLLAGLETHRSPHVRLVESEATPVDSRLCSGSLSAMACAMSGVVRHPDATPSPSPGVLADNTMRERRFAPLGKG